MQLDVAGHGTAYAYTGGKPFDPSLPCVVFVHGALNDHSVWTLLARWFAHHGHGVLAIDQPGHGRSLGAPLANVEALAGWLFAVLDAAGIAEAALVGHSMGSLIALEAAARAPERATRLVMLGTRYPMQVSAALLAEALDAPLKAIDTVVALSHNGMAAKPSFPGPGTWLRGADRALMRRVQSNHANLNLFHHDFSVCDRYAHGMEAAARVACPVDLILGSHDRMTSPKQVANFARTLKARVSMVNAGHALMSEAPDAVLAALRRALGPVEEQALV